MRMMKNDAPNLPVDEQRAEVAAQKSPCKPEAAAEKQQENTKILVDVTYNGLTYKKGHFVVTKYDESVEFDMAESHLLKDMKDAIAGVLPDLPDEVVKSVEETLKALGATTSDDLKYIKESDLLPVLKTIQARRLVAAWTQNGHSSPVQLLSSPSTSSSPGSSTIASSPSGLQTSLIPDWVERFEIPWERFPEELIQNLKRQKRPSARQRREMVSIVVSEMMKLCRNPTKQNTTEIAKRMVTKYPKSFQDVIDGDVIGPGYHSLVKQLQSRVENVKRPDTPKVIKRKAAPDHDDDIDEIPAEQKATV
ncbi:hypothetical protein FQA47_014489 [Oryzias melastigma]|uniref:Uncharacterized protein n=1 Tax=Oryzias melastigma TaxID=30732 RepID=A0A834C2D0_ORYME|nr:hypothetical protein FQA47_014489 [Oryzias melastigma]